MKLAYILVSFCLLGVGAFFLCTKLMLPEKFHVSSVQGKKNIVPIAIIGGGVSGLSSAIYGGRSGFHTVAFQGYELGGQLTETSMVENWPGVDRGKGLDVMPRVEKQAQSFGAILVPRAVDDIDFSSWPYKLTISNGDVVYALSMIIGTGTKPRKLGIPGEQEYWGRGVLSCAKCDSLFTKDKKVFIIGGGDTAIEYALQVAPYAKDIGID